ncbi:MAG TPA: 2-oxoglutarate and iron-dependent oxygenase domain-containing protein [Stellaceae bacterium]|nr:2-oxoglutarate and iron-dependent oxygenase domain-containing protein [Stellaceae bacterium]
MTAIETEGTTTADFRSIPIVDISPLRGADAAARAACGRAIDAACRNVGFFYARGHGVDSAVLSGVFAAARAFFALPEVEKMRVAMKASPLFRGYFPLGGEVTDPAVGGDVKEGFDMALDLSPDDPDVRAGKPLHGPNQWPAGPAGFRDALTRYYDALADLGRLISRGLALGLRLPESFFAANLDRPTAILRVLHYPPQDAPIGPPGCGAHSDYGYLTILAQDEVGGLQVQNRAGEWIDAPPVPGTFVCNLGEMMGQWTNDQYPATRHRVINLSGRERYSVPFFFHPNFDVEVSCLPSCQGPGNPPRHAPVMSGDYVLKRLTESYIKL